MTLLFGNLTQDFVVFTTVLGDPAKQDQIPAAADAFRSSAAKNASYLVYIGTSSSRHFRGPVSLLHRPSGIGMFCCTYIYMFVWVYTGEINAKRVRERYLQAVLRQDIQYFDKVGAGEVATRIQTDTRMFPSFLSLWDDSYFLLPDLVQQGTSEKVALVVSFLAAFVCGFILAYVRSWRLALAMSSILPCIAITGGIMNKFISNYMQYVTKPSFPVERLTLYVRLSLKHVAEGGNMAEEVISTVRTAQAFGTQAILAGLYDAFIDKSLNVDMKAAIWHGGGLGVFFFVIYSAYGLGTS